MVILTHPTKMVLPFLVASPHFSVSDSIEAMLSVQLSLVLSLSASLCHCLSGGGVLYKRTVNITLSSWTARVIQTRPANKLGVCGAACQMNRLGQTIFIFIILQ